MIVAAEVRSLARVTLANFGAVLFVSLFMVINQGPTTAALQLIGSGILTLIVTAPNGRVTRCSRPKLGNHEDLHNRHV